MNFFDLGSLKAEEADLAFKAHERMVDGYLLLLEQGYCLQIGCSYAKDSTCVLNGAIDAMYRAIHLGYIEKSHPLVIINVDTLLESESIQCYVPHAYRLVLKKCQELGINAISKIVSPPIYNQLMTLYAGAQKLPATSESGRNADCSIIFKITPSLAALKKIKEDLPLKYQNTPWVSISGSRVDESVRRSKNMEKQGVSGQVARGLIERIEQEGEKAKHKVFKFAPIQDWTTEFVISYLNHCGKESMAKTPLNKQIPAFNKNFGLLLAIYGEGSNDACQIVLKDDENKAEQNKCGKIARYGCVTCLMVGEDHSSQEMKKYKRWARFGDGTIRLRDYMARVSLDVKYRAFHARAYDPASNNNVFMQPNTLKSKVLSKIIWYAAQITNDCEKIHSNAVKMHQEGNIMQDDGVQDIMNDSTLSHCVKIEYVEMYINRLIEKPMFELFTEKHAVLLSLLWSLHGVSAPVYHPCSILDKVKNGERIPFPPTNKELNEKYGKLGLGKWNDKNMVNSQIPDALVIQLFKPANKKLSELKATYGNELNESHLQDHLPFELAEAWNKKSVQFDALGMTYNHVTSTAKETRPFKLTYRINKTTGHEHIQAKDSTTGRLMPLQRNHKLHALLLDLGRGDYAQEMEISAEKRGITSNELDKERKVDGGEYEVSCNHQFNNQMPFTSDVKFISSAAMRKKVSYGKKYSGRKRTYCKKTGKFTPGRASLKVYKASTVPALENQTVNTVDYWLPDFSLIRHSAITLHDDITISEEEATQSFVFDDDIFNLWMKSGGWQSMISEHDDQVRALIAKRAPVRSYGGTNPVYKLTSNSGLTTTLSFEKYMLKTLKRTEIFDDANLFNLAGLNYEKIASYPCVINMETHRQQKADHLLAVRYLKNKRRNEIKNLLDSKLQVTTGYVIQSVQTRINEFFEQYDHIAKQYIASLAMSVFSEDAKSRKDKIEIWLTEFAYVMNNVDEALSLLSTKEELSIINEDYDGKKVAAKFYEAKKSELLEQLTKFYKLPLLTIESLMSENTNEEIISVNGHYESKGNTENSIKSISKWIVKHYPRTNVFLIAHGLTTCIAMKDKKPYVCPVFGSPESANTAVKIKERAKKSQEDFFNMKTAFSLKALVFAPLLKEQKSSVNTATVQVSKAAQSKKLSLLMKSKLKMIEVLREEA